MPTDPSPFSEQQLHQLRAVAESFGVDAERYDRARPRYPEALIERVIAASPGLEFLDVGCGTGIGARQYRASGCTVLGVEPDARMAEVAERTGVEVEIGKFEDWDPEGRYFDAVVAGQAWHWVDPVLGASKAARVLRPHGLLAVYWHVFDPPGEVADAFDEAMQRVRPPPLWNRPDGSSQPGGGLSLRVSQPDPPSSAPVRLALIGLGNMGMAHLAIFKSLEPQARISAWPTVMFRSPNAPLPACQAPGFSTTPSTA